MKIENLSDKEYQTQVLDWCERYSRLYLGVISDALDVLGDRNHFLGPQLRPIDGATRLVGPAYPVRGEQSSIEHYEDDAYRLLGMFEQVPMNSVMVYDTNDVGSDSAHFGELSATAVRHRGVRGIVVDGNVRDSNFLLSEGFPTFCRGFSPLDGYGRWHIVEWNVPITIHGVLINPGDFIYGDRDGVVRIPKDIVLEVLEKSEEDRRVETQIRSAVREGESPVGLFTEHGRF